MLKLVQTLCGLGTAPVRQKPGYAIVRPIMSDVRHTVNIV